MRRFWEVERAPCLSSHLSTSGSPIRSACVWDTRMLVPRADVVPRPLQPLQVNTATPRTCLVHAQLYPSLEELYLY